MISGGSTTVYLIIVGSGTIILDVGQISIIEELCPKLYKYILKLKKFDTDYNGPPSGLLNPKLEYFIGDLKKVFLLLKSCIQYLNQTRQIESFLDDDQGHKQLYFHFV
jgi:hypothetical protein